MVPFCFLLPYKEMSRREQDNRINSFRFHKTWSTIQNLNYYHTVNLERPKMGVFEHLADPGKGVLIAGALVAVYFIHAFSVWYQLSHIPGPRWAALSKYWMVKEALKGRQPVAFKQATDRYGKK